MLRLEQEINEQPDVIAGLLTREWGTVQTIAAAVRAFDPTFVCIAARGTSDNAARYAQYAFGAFLRLPVMLATPSLHTLYETPPNLARALVIGISQSGRAEDARQVLADARAQGALTLAITNDAASPMALTAEYHFALSAGEERSVAATKTYTAELTAIAMLTAALSEDESLRRALAALPSVASETLRHSEAIAGWAERYRYMEHCISVGRGFNFATAFEVNLKVQELCYIPGHGYSEADLRHGPIAMVQSGFPVIIVAPSGKAQPLMADLLDKLRERDAETIVISDNDALLAAGTRAARLPANIPEWLTPIVAVMPGQVFAMRLAEAKGYPVDAPRGLTKVTVTR